MVKLSIIYPNTPGVKFDMDYFTEKHVPMIFRLLGDACKGMSAEEGIQGLYSAPYIAIASFLFESGESLINTAVRHAKDIARDIPNFTEIIPQIQVGIVKI